MRPRRTAAALLVCASLSCIAGACVTGVERRPSSSEAARETPPPPADEPHAGQIATDMPKAKPDPTPETPLGPDWVWVRGYWHWDGVRHVWMRGRWERARPGYVRLPPR